LNNDTIVDPNFLKEMTKVAEEDPEIGILGPKMYYYNNDHRGKTLWYAGGKINMCLTHVPVAHNKVDYGQYDKTMETDWIAAACMLINLI
jgi:GT2 family glycosyltransferase